MAISGTDHQDLGLTLFEGLFDASPWHVFLRKLLARSGADRALLVIRHHAEQRHDLHERAGPAGGEEAERAALDALGLAGLRAGRVYALDELRELDDAGRRAVQDAGLAEARIGDARLLRIAAPGGYAVWLVLLHQRPVLGAADSALLTSLVPAVQVAVFSHARLAVLRSRAAAAEGSLALLGIGQAVLDRAGQPLGMDAVWNRAMPVVPAGPRGSPFAAACAELEGPGAEPVLVPLEQGAVLLRPFAEEGAALPAEAVAVASIRLAKGGDPAPAAQVVAAALGLSAREAALAVLLSRGQGLVEAGQSLRLTAETARNYSKRIYAKTGARGQADLVRMVLESLAVLA